MNLQAEISQERGELFIGRELDIIAEEIDSETGEIWGRSYRDAPEVDGLVCVSGADGVKEGDIMRTRINDCALSDLFGEAVA